MWKTNKHSVNTRIVIKTSYIRNLSANITSDVMLKYQKWQHWYQWYSTSGVVSKQPHLCFVRKGNVRWKRIFLPMVTIVVLHHKHMKLLKPFTPHVIAWAIRGFDQSIRRTKEQKTRLQCLAWTMPKSVMPSGVMKSTKLLRRKNARIW